MTRSRQPGYRFLSEAQWDLCSFSGADRTSLQFKSGLRPFAPYGLPPASLWNSRAYAPAITGEAELLWRSFDGHLMRLPYGDALPLASAAPPAIRGARRMVEAGGTLWAVARDGSAQAFDTQSLSRLIEVRFNDRRVRDLASDSHDSVWLLACEGGHGEIVHLNCAGGVEASFPLGPGIDASQLAYLGETDTIVLLALDRSRIHFLDAKVGTVVRTVLISALRPCFTPFVIASDRCSRLFIAGADGAPNGGGNQIVLVDGDGGLLGLAPVPDRVTGLAATPSQLFATTRTGVLRFSSATLVPDGWGELRASLITPLLKSASSQPQKWLRAEASALLGEGCSIEISWATPKRGQDPHAIDAILHDKGLSEAQRIDRWRQQVDLQTSLYRGSASTPGEVVFSAPLHEVTGQLIWIEVAVTAAPGGNIPSVSKLSVYYPGPTLIREMPAIYRQHELGSGDFLRSLVGLLEAGTQQLDGKIGELGRNIHPATADGDWLDYVASWLGLPWDNGLAIDQKRRLVASAAKIASGRGTRLGLEALLEALLPGPERRFRMVDINVDHGLATIAGPGCEGSRLPAILAGLPLSSSVLGTRAILGKARLPCAEGSSETAGLLGHLRVDVAATIEERSQWEPWLGRLIEAMVPASARVELRWAQAGAFDAGRIGAASMLGAEAEAHLGTDAVTGSARLGGRRRTILPTRLTRDSTLQ